MVLCEKVRICVSDGKDNISFPTQLFFKSSKLVFTADDKQLVDSLRQLKGYSSRKFLTEFLQKN